MTDIVIASAARTPVGSFNGAFGSLPAHDLGKVAIQGALERAKVKPEEVDEVSILGEKVTVERLDGTATYSSPGRPVADISNVMVEYHPVPPPPRRTPRKKSN